MTPFARALLDWYDAHGRKDLPWRAQGPAPRDPYPIWISEIMLQQTQVATVIPYFLRFVQRFPDVARLAHASLDEVLELWTGLGYYARARNLHAAAQRIAQAHAGRFPEDVEAVSALPGIGRSTAGAILAFAFEQRHAILDGNVKRVLARYHAIGGWPGERAVEQALWARAHEHTPDIRVSDYTQAIMDLGARVCGRRPLCAECPVRAGCRARALGDARAFPAPRPRKSLPVRATVMLLIENPARAVLLVQRPPSGVWGGLWGPPECEPGADAAAYCRERLGLKVRLGHAGPMRRHTFSHFHLDITPLPARLVRAQGLMENAGSIWYNVASPDARGLAAPVTRLLHELRNASWPAW